ncbi:hypothetical protein [Streptomyces sp. NPDC051561]|uniref:hypothetical protein n=1 Tax=Streptomyces sp. NPDC051561 TaxID=3365658 RepID=UPI0037A998E2
MNERRYLHGGLVEEVNRTYADIVTAAWSLVHNSERYHPGKKASLARVKQVAKGMEDAALILLKNMEREGDFPQDAPSPESRIKADRERYATAYRKDAQEADAIRLS